MSVRSLFICLKTRPKIYVNAIMNVRVYQNTENLLTNRGIISFSNTLMHREVSYILISCA